MGCNNDSSTIDVSARGVSSATFTSVDYRVSAVTEGPTGPAAKDLARPIIDAALEVIRKHGPGAGVDMDRLRTSLSVDTFQVYDDRVQRHGGYRVSWSCSFSGTDIGASLVLHDALTSIAGVQSPSPVFRTDGKTDAHDRAFADAVKKARRKFEAQCQAIGVDPTNYRVKSWDVREEEQRGMGKTLSIDPQTAGLGMKPVGAEPGKAVVEVNVTLYFGLGR